MSFNDGTKEAYEFTDVNRSYSLGIAVKGDSWKRPVDTFGLAFALNWISSAARAYFAAGGLGILVGDGQLPRPGTERIVESYYAWRISQYLAMTVDYQYVANPAYNRDRGPVSIFALRLHAEF